MTLPCVILDTSPTHIHHDASTTPKQFPTTKPHHIHTDVTRKLSQGHIGEQCKQRPVTQHFNYFSPLPSLCVFTPPLHPQTHPMLHNLCTSCCTPSPPFSLVLVPFPHYTIPPPPKLRRQKPHKSTPFDSTKGYPGEGPTFSILSLNVSKGLASKSDHLSKLLIANEIDFACLQEGNLSETTARNLQTAGYSAFETSRQFGGVVLCLKAEWSAHLVEQKVLWEGRTLALTLRKNETAVTIVGVYFPSGLDSMTKTHPDVLKAVQTIDLITDLGLKSHTCIVLGDFNCRQQGLLILEKRTENLPSHPTVMTKQRVVSIASTSKQTKG